MVKAAAEESAVLLVLQAHLVHARLEVKVLVFDLMIVLLELLVLIFIGVRLHLHLVLVVLLCSLLRGCGLLILRLDRLPELHDLGLQLEFLGVPLVL